MAPRKASWRAVEPGSRIFQRGTKEFTFQEQEHGFCSKVYTNQADAKKHGPAEYAQWKQQYLATLRGDKPPKAAAAAPQAAAAAAGPPTRQQRVKRRKASPDASTDGILQVEVQQQLPEAAAAGLVAVAPPTQGRKRRQGQPAAAAAQNKRQRRNAPSPAAAAAAGCVGTAGTDTGPERYMEQTPSAATDAATVPPGKPRKQQRQPAKEAAAAAKEAVAAKAAAAAKARLANRNAAAQPAKPVRKRGRQAAAAAGGAQDLLLPPGGAAAALVESESVSESDSGSESHSESDSESESKSESEQPLPRANGGRAAAAAAAGAPAVPAPAHNAAAAVAGPGVAPRALRPRQGRGEAAAAGRGRVQQQQQQQQGGERGAVAAAAAAAAGGTKRCRGKQHAVEADSHGKMFQGGQHHHHHHQQQQQQQQYADDKDDEGHWSGQWPSSVATPQPEQSMSESAGSNWLSPAAPAAAAAGAGHPQAAPAAADGSSMHVWYQGSKQACDGLQLDMQLQEQLGKGGFGAVRRALVKATGDNSLATLKLTGPLNSSLKTLVKAHKAKAKARTAGGGTGGGAAAAGGGRGRGTQATARSRAGSRGGGGGSNGGGAGGSDGSSDGGAWVPMALKVALSFDQLSRDMQDNFGQASAFDANVQQRMRDEYDFMTACAASPHILDAFCMGTLWLAGSWRPCILMELSALGDAESVYVTPANSLAGSGPRGISAVAAQRIVRQAAVALKDLHTMAGSMHLDLKVNNLLVFGSKDSPSIKLCDFGCAKKRNDEPRYGPASGTKDWQAPEQMAADLVKGPVAGRLDYCTDSWALGLLVLSLRKGQQPFWWLKQEGKLPSEMPDALRVSLASTSSPYQTDSPRGSKLTRLELAFVQTCLASHSSSRPSVKALLQDDAYLSSRYRGG